MLARRFFIGINMTTILSGQAATFSLILARDGAPVPIDPTSAVRARVYAADGVTPLTDEKVITAAPGWTTGVVTVSLSSTDTAVPTGEAMVLITSTVPTIAKRFRLVVEAANEVQRSALFVRDIAVDRLRSDSLMMSARGAMPAVTVSDDYLWDKLRAAEAETAHELRVPLAPTAFFPAQPTPEEITALAGKPWAIDAGYDYHPQDFAHNDRWGFIKLRNKPLVSVSRVRFAYPGGPTAHYDLPLDWLRVDAKHGQVQFVPSSTAFAAPLNAFVMQAIGQGRTIPLAIQISYVAGLADAHRNYPELIDLIMKKASLKTIEDAYLPQSGSISADGLSQSVSNDMSKHAETIDRIMNGGKGSNGGLMAAIHGVRMGVL